MKTKSVFKSLPRLETERLILRRLQKSDVDDVFAYASDPEVARHVMWNAHASREESEIFLRMVVGQYRRGAEAPWGIVLKEEDRIIGTCGFITWHPAHARAEVGYAIGRHYWNRGYTTEAVWAVLAFGFETLGLYRIEAICKVPNVASARVMEKLRMTYEGILRGYVFTKGEHHDVKSYAILRPEWERRRSDS